MNSRIPKPCELYVKMDFSGTGRYVLFGLNHDFQESKQGRYDKKKPATKKTDAKPVKDTATLFDMQEDNE